MQLTLLSIAVLLLLAWLYVRRRGQSAVAKKPDRRTNAGSTGGFHAVSIKYDEKACDAAKDLAGRRFLSSAAPRLPLPECNALECRCRFAHHNDRRTGKDRRSPFAAAGFGGGTGSFEKERRENPERRKDEDFDIL